MSNILTILSITITIMVPLSAYIYKFWKERKSPYTGIWEDEIYVNNCVIKKDIFYLKQKGNIITGTAKRTYPEDQKQRRYEIQGRLLGKDFVALFWATNQTALSYGCWFITQTNDTTFEGHYLKFAQKGNRRTPITRAKLIRSKRSIKDFNKIK